MEMQSHKLHILHLVGKCNHLLHILHGNAELVLGKTCSDVGVCVCTYVGIYAETYVSLLLHAACNLVDDLQLRDAFYIEVLDTGLESQFYFPVALSNTGKDNFRSRESCVQTSLYLTTADAVGSESGFCNMSQYFRCCTSLHRIMQVISFVLVSLVLYCL